MKTHDIDTQTHIGIKHGEANVIMYIQLKHLAIRLEFQKIKKLNTRYRMEDRHGNYTFLGDKDNELFSLSTYMSKIYLDDELADIVRSELEKIKIGDDEK